MSKTSPFLAALVFLSGMTFARAEPTATVREYRPLMAKSVTMVVAGGASADAKKGAAFTSEGWARFDAKEWDAAMDKFLSALEKDATDHSAAEGLIMSLHRSGDHATTSRLAAEIAAIMPGVKDILVRTITAEVRALVGRGEIETAGALLAHFPKDDIAYGEARGLLVSAKVIGAELDADKAGSTAPASLAGN
ncbi:MAG: hypothetical protein GXX91_14580 [Verrucomicrobiaceae bacterium]|nr:hypothetical protein [Verrucomicrobiaceae bacterium]